MNVLIIYDSTSSTIELIAQTIAKTLRMQGPVYLSAVEEMSGFNLKTVDMLIVGCPTQGLDLTPGMRAYLESVPPEALNGLMAATFDTRPRISVWETGSAAWCIANHLERLGATLLSPPESFFVVDDEDVLEEGEFDRAARWATTLLDCSEADLSRAR